MAWRTTGTEFKDELEARGHTAVAVDLPGDDDSAGLSTYADIVTAEIEDDANTILVAQSMGGFTAAMVCTRVHVPMLIMLNAMIPVPGETAGEWWANTGAEEARVAAARAGGYSVEFDDNDYFLHDLPADERAALEAPLPRGVGHCLRAAMPDRAVARHPDSRTGGKRRPPVSA